MNRMHPHDQPPKHTTTAVIATESRTRQMPNRPKALCAARRVLLISLAACIALLVATTRAENPLVLVDDIDLSQDQALWTFVLADGSAVSGTANGLCVSVPEMGENYAAWIYTTLPGSSNGYITLVDGDAWRVRTHVTSSQLTPYKNPFMVFDIVNNYFTPGFALLSPGTYGATFVLFDNEGGANAPTARAPGLGRDYYDLWYTPPAVLTPQWRGLIDQSYSAFARQEDTINDMNLELRILDMDSSGYGSEFDSGTVCLTRFEIARTPLLSIWTPYELPSYAPPIASTFFSPASYQPEEDLDQTQSIGEIDDATHVVHYKLRPGLKDGIGIDPGQIKTFLPYDPSKPIPNQQLYPLTWETNRLHLGTIDLWAEGADDKDPYDLMWFYWQVPTNENFSQALATRGFPNSGATDNHMYRAASPRLPSHVGYAPQTYVALFHSQNRTLSAGTDDPARITARIQFGNYGDQFGTATDGQDPFDLANYRLYTLADINETPAAPPASLSAFEPKEDVAPQ